MNRSLTIFAFLSSLVCCIHASERPKSPLPEPTDSLTASIASASSTPSEQEYQDNNAEQPMDALTAAASSQGTGFDIPAGHFGPAMRENPFDRPGGSLETEEPRHSASLCCSTRLLAYVKSWWSSSTASEEKDKNE